MTFEKSSIGWSYSDQAELRDGPIEAGLEDGIDLAEAAVQKAHMRGLGEEPGPGGISHRADHDSEHGPESQQARSCPPLEPTLAFDARALDVLLGTAALEARDQELSLAARDLDRCVIDPRFELCQPRPRQEVVGMPIGRLPLVGRGHQRLVTLESAPVPIDPAGQPIPLAEEGLVRDLDGRLLRRGLAIERQQPATAERVEHGRKGDRIELEPRQVRQRQPSARLRGADAELDEMQENLHRHPLLVSPQPVVDRLRTARQDPPDPAESAIPIERERGLGPLVEELGEGELQERQRPRPIGGIGDQLSQQSRFDGDSATLGGPDDDRLELVRGHRKRVLDARSEDLGKLWMKERPVVVVRPQRKQHRDLRVRLGHRAGDRVEEAPAGDLIGDREQLLELVDDQEHATTLRHHPNRHRRRIRSRLGIEQRRQARRDARGRRDDGLYLGQWVRAGDHLRDDPAVRSGNCPLAKPRNQACRDCAGLARPGGANQRDEVCPRFQRSNEPLDECVAAEVVGGIGLRERTETLVRVALRSLRRAVPAVAAATGHGGGSAPGGAGAKETDRGRARPRGSSGAAGTCGGTPRGARCGTGRA